MKSIWGEKEFQAKDVSKVINNHDSSGAVDFSGRPEILRELLFPSHTPGRVVTPKSVGWALKRHANNPVRYGTETLILRRVESEAKDRWLYKVEAKVEV
jgi:hypothetical protein